ncbi:phosphoadenosine phosphosulfate reductase family protein [Bacteroides sp.]|uniref:phosphoadenosine phosphosulfate reductase family protein n=1 Tax=Bacteroides sp. TaxID=29523 RepID=UPI002633F47A|nr:phosphoadenosine phosphosulfate reductase family protein [Bacteroides sp.]MDD3041312.1 phosphoadenosine phosphosulfate reductase family protein [Bacteroides sp.]
MQGWSFERKIQVTQLRILEWYEKWGGKVYISFSGGKDSTVLLDLARRMYPDVPAVFCDTGLEYPEIREFVKSKDNVEWLRPMRYNKSTKSWEPTNFKEVIKTEGYPLISKEVSRHIHDVRKLGNDCFAAKMFTGERGQYDISKYKFLISAPFDISNKCCTIMKKNPFHVYEKESDRKPIIATMASESRQRRTQWLRDGCNSFDGKISSKPISFWTDQDVLRYIKTFNIKYATVYGDIVEDERGRLLTTGENRTGCMFCMYGCHLEKEPNKFQRMKISHPKQYDYCIRSVDDNGLGLGEILDYIGVPYK